MRKQLSASLYASVATGLSAASDEHVKNCPKCGAKLSGAQLIHPESKTSAAEKTKKQPPLASLKTKKQASPGELERSEKQPARKAKSEMSTQISPSASTR